MYESKIWLESEIETNLNLCASGNCGSEGELTLFGSF